MTTTNLFLAAVAGSLATLGGAEVYNFEGVSVPPSLTLGSEHLFFVEGGVSEGGSGGVITLKDLKLQADRSNGGNSLTEKQLENYTSVQVGLLPMDLFFEMLDPQDFCKSGAMHLRQDSPKMSMVMMEKVVFRSGGGPAPPVQKVLNKTGAYLLVLTNCGGLAEGVVISGTVELTNSWGYLSVFEQFKASFFGALALFYATICFAWLFLSLKWWAQLFSFQKGILFVVALATLEAVLWWSYFAAMNVWSMDGRLIRLMLELLSGNKLCFMIQVLWKLDTEGLGGNFGKGQPGVEEAKEQNMVRTAWSQGMLLAFLGAFFHMRITLYYRYSKLLKLGFVLTNCMPCVCIGIGILVQAMWSMLQFVVNQPAHGEREKSLLIRTQGVLLLAIVASALVAVVQLMDPLASVQQPSYWKYHFLVTDALPQVSFLAGLLMMLAIWRPTEQTQGYLYTGTAMEDGETVGKPGDLWTDDEDKEEGKREQHLEVESFAVE